MNPIDHELLLEVRDLEICGDTGEGEKTIVNKVSFDLHKGEVLGLIGESGAGKSTIGLACMGYTRDGSRISGGQVLFNGEDLARASKETLRSIRTVRIAYVAQSAGSAFNPAHRLAQQHAEGALQHRVMNKTQARKNAEELYRKLQLPNPERIGDRFPHQLSGGQLQRAMTAMALSCHPDLIIFDEPTTALDVTTQIEVLGVIREVIREFNCAALYISHDLAVVAQMADRILVLKNGSVVEEQATRAMLAQPKQEYTKSLWAVRTIQTRAAQINADSQPVMRVENVSASYGDQPVLDDVSLALYKGHTLAVIGESGSGKSTTARAMTGLLQPSVGEIYLNGEVLAPRFTKRRKDQLRAIQMIYQIPENALNPRQKIADIIGRPLELYLGLKGQAKRDRVRELLELIELDPDVYMQRQPRELSGGQQQRIGIARALAAEPEVIICDEVTSALDRLVAAEILKLLKRIQAQTGVAFMFITHDISTVRAIADQVVVMKQGKVVDSGGRDDVLTPPYPPYTQLLINSEPQMDPDWLDHYLEVTKPEASLCAKAEQMEVELSQPDLVKA